MYLIARKAMIEKKKEREQNLIWEFSKQYFLKPPRKFWQPPSPVSRRLLPSYVVKSANSKNKVSN
jgi:pyoverdine/dityrosine biosynthesis protein Dit1